MTTTALHEQTVNVAGKPMFVAEAGDGLPVVMLHGGGPGASGVSNYSRNIDSLAEHFRVIVPDLPGYGRSAKGVDQSDPFGYLADMIRGLLDELGVGPACWQACPHGSRWDRDYPRCPHRRTQEFVGVLRRRRTQPRQAGDIHPQLPCLRGCLRA